MIARFLNCFKEIHHCYSFKVIMAETLSPTFVNQQYYEVAALLFDKYAF